MALFSTMANAVERLVWAHLSKLTVKQTCGLHVVFGSPRQCIVLPRLAWRAAGCASGREVAQHAFGRIVARRAYDRAGRMAARAAGVEPMHGCRVRQAVAEPERIIDVMDMAAGNTEILLDFGRRQRKDVGHQRGGSGREEI